MISRNASEQAPALLVDHAGDDDVDGVGSAESIGSGVRLLRPSKLAMKKKLVGTAWMGGC